MIKLTPAEARELFREVEENEVERDRLTAEYRAVQHEIRRGQLELARERLELARQREERARAKEAQRLAELERQRFADGCATIFTVASGLIGLIATIIMFFYVMQF